MEVVNKTLKNILKKKLDLTKGLWADELPQILWLYRITMKISIGETPFSLTYGTKAMILVEILLVQQEK